MQDSGEPNDRVGINTDGQFVFSHLALRSIAGSPHVVNFSIVDDITHTLFHASILIHVISCPPGYFFYL